jgi:hypothetical protein
MQVHVRNDVKPSVGRVVILEREEKTHARSIPSIVEACINLGCYSPSFVDLKRCILLIFFIACILLVKKTVLRTSKTFITGILLILIFLVARYHVRSHRLSVWVRTRLLHLIMDVNVCFPTLYINYRYTVRGGS